MIEIIYWSGYVICFIFILLFGAWLVANENEVDISNVLIAFVVLLPLLSWLLILLIVLPISFEAIKEKK